MRHHRRTGACLPPAATDQRGRRCIHRRVRRTPDTILSSLPPGRRSPSSKTSWPTTPFDDELRALHRQRPGRRSGVATLTYRAVPAPRLPRRLPRPILKGHEALCFDPHSDRGWEPVPPHRSPSTARFFISFRDWPCSPGSASHRPRQSHASGLGPLDADCSIPKEIVMQLASRFASFPGAAPTIHCRTIRFAPWPRHLRGHPARKPLQTVQATSPRRLC